MTAQEIFNEKGFKTSDNRSLEWRNINKAISLWYRGATCKSRLL
jgi:hypothetical protein